MLELKYVEVFQNMAFNLQGSELEEQKHDLALCTDWVCDHEYLSDTVVLAKRGKEKKQNLVVQRGSNEKKLVVMPTKAFLI